MIDQPCRFGPVLYLRGVDEHRICLAMLAGHPADDPPPGPTCHLDVSPAQRIGGRRGLAIWRYILTVPRGRDETTFRYQWGDRRWQVVVPGESHLRIAVTACNGTEQADVGDASDLPERNERWRDLAHRHRQRPFHVLLQAGDQAYADLVWRKVPELARLCWPFGLARPSKRFAADTAEQVSDHFFSLYTRLLAQDDLRDILGSIPSAMMWDDHDIYDGYGSHPSRWRHSAAHRGVFAIARDHFRLFQLALSADEAMPRAPAKRREHFNWCHRFGDVGIIAPDLRSTRTFQQVMSEACWADFEAELASLARCRAVIVVSTVPVVNVPLDRLERAFALCPSFIDAHNDLRDQWQSFAHRDEWLRILRLLLDFSRRSGARVIVVSGEIHLAAVGQAGAGETLIWQLTTPGVVHPPPSPVMTGGMNWLARDPSRLPGGIEVRMLPFPGADRSFIRARGWLALDVERERSPTAEWHLENEKTQRMITLESAPPR